MFALAPRSSSRFVGLVINNNKYSRCKLSTSSTSREVITKEERAIRRAARKERANAYLSSIGGGAAAEGTAAGKAAEASSGGLGFDATRLGWYAAVLIPTAFIGWGVYDEESPPAQLSRFIGLADRLNEFAKPARTKLLPDWNQVRVAWTEDAFECTSITFLIFLAY